MQQSHAIRLALVAVTLALGACTAAPPVSPAPTATPATAAPTASPARTVSPAATAETTPAPTLESTNEPRVEPIEGSFDVGGHSLYLKCTGTGSPTILYFHGSIEDRSTMPVSNVERIRQHLGDEYRFCAYDRRNVGRSDTVDAVQSPDDLMSDLENLLAAAGIEGPYVLLGASFGGLAAYMFANRHPEDVLGMVLADAMFPELLALDSYWPDEDHYIAFDEQDECCELERVSHYKMLATATDYIGHESAIPLIYLASRAEGFLNEGPPEFRAAAAEDLQAFVDRFSPGSLRTVDSPHEMEPAIPDQIADALREVIELAGH